MKSILLKIVEIGYNRDSATKINQYSVIGGYLIAYKVKFRLGLL